MSEGLMITCLFSAYGAGFLLLRHGAVRLRFPALAAALLAAVAIPSLLQLAVPSMLGLLQRDGPRILGGQWWRMATSLFAQDGGVGGMLFNLVCLAMLGTVADLLLGGWAVVALFFAGGLAGNIAGLAWQPIGAGNSIGNFGIAAGLAVVCLLCPTAPLASRALAALGLAAGAALLAAHDIHGAAALGGALAALIWRWRTAARPAERTVEAAK